MRNLYDTYAATQFIHIIFIINTTHSLFKDQSSRRGSNALFDGRDGSLYSFGSSSEEEIWISQISLYSKYKSATSTFRYFICQNYVHLVPLLPIIYVKTSFFIAILKY